MATVRAEIEYVAINGDRVHSDIDSDINTEEGKAFLRDCFEEWLQNSGGSGIFYTGDLATYYEENA